jgi:hypothetical protein
MGCDIHAYVEYSDFDTDRGPYWKNFTRNTGSRNYVMFGVLAGVRCPDVKLHEPKGMTAGSLGYNTADDYWLYVAPASNPEWADREGYTSLERAEGWVASGYSVADYGGDGKLNRVSGPDWHSHSWLTTDELSDALAHYETVAPKYWPDGASAPPEWRAMLAAMREFEAAGNKTRIVFWFDN